MSTIGAVAVFAAGADVSLATSWVLVSRIERVGNRLGASEAMLGLFAALAADTPEITSAISALSSHQQAVGSGVIVGSNVFNLAALLGLGAVVAGRIALHRRVVVLAGAVALWVAAACLLVVVGAVPPWAGLLLVLGVVVPSVVLAASEGTPGRAALRPRRRRSSRVRAWLAEAVAEEEMELLEAIRPRRGRPIDVLVTVVALAVVVAASVAMERAASSLGTHFAVPGIVVGGVALAAVTSLPNAVAAVYLARRGRGAAMLSTALNSNALNVAVGLLLPATVLGLGRASTHEVFLAWWYLGLTAVVLFFAHADRGLRRDAGLLILGAYVAFVGVLLATSGHAAVPALASAGPAAAVVAVSGLLLLLPGRRGG